MRNRVLLTVFALLGLPASHVAAAPAGSVAVVNAPLAHIAETLGGGALDVIFPVPEDVDPAYWQPSPEQVQLYQQADLILLNGAGYAGWTETEILPRTRLVDTTVEVRDRLIPSEATGKVHKHGPEGEHSHDGTFAFTTWLAPDIAKAQVDVAATEIARRWPELAATVEAGQAILHEDIDAMDDAFSEFFEGVAERQIFVSHPVYQYLDRAYPGAFVSLHWEPDADPGEAEWSELEKTLDRSRTPLMLWEGEPIPDTIARLEGLGVEMVVLSPMAAGPRNVDLFRQLGDQVKFPDMSAN